MGTLSLSEQILERTVILSRCSIPDRIFHEAKRCILDYCGVVLAGAETNRKKNKKYLKTVHSEGNITVFGMSQKTDVYTAALLNGMDAHVIELDDGHRFGMLHMGAPIISAIFAVAEERKIEGIRILRSIICGYDIAIALARHMQPGHKLKGYHATGTCCTVGAAMAIALLLDYDMEQMQGTLSAAATSAAGLLEVIDDASQLKPYNIGRAAMDAVAAAFTGAAGFRGPDDVIGGKRGFYAALASLDDYQSVKRCTLFEENVYAISEIYTKSYAACRHCHPAIEGALYLRKNLYPLDVNQIERIKVHTYKLAIDGHDHIEVRSVSSAKMSTPYSVAVAIIYGLCGLNAYENKILTDKTVAKLMSRIAVVLSEELDALNPQKRSAIVEVEFKNGIIVSKRVDYPKGEPENRLDDAELELKTKELVLFGGKTDDEVKEIFSSVWNYEDYADSLYFQLN